MFHTYSIHGAYGYELILSKPASAKESEIGLIQIHSIQPQLPSGNLT